MSLTRGVYIGVIIDRLSELSLQIKFKNKLGLTNLSKLTEDFVMGLLNRIHDWDLRNLNEERSNAKGLDLGDTRSKIGIQVTATKTGDKVNGTLEKVDKLVEGEECPYEHVVIVMLCGKQDSYSTLEVRTEAEHGYTFDHHKDLWDFETLFSQMISLEVDRLREIYDFVVSEITRVKIEEEMPDPSGEYPTDITRTFESIPAPYIGEPNALVAWCSPQGKDEALRENVKHLHAALSKLPRTSRQLLVYIIERCQHNGSLERYGTYRLDYFVLKRLVSSLENDLLEELGILSNGGIIRGPDFENARVEWGEPANIELGSTQELWGLFERLIPFVEEHHLALRRLFVTLDFSGFESTAP